MLEKKQGQTGYEEYENTLHSEVVAILRFFCLYVASIASELLL